MTPLSILKVITLILLVIIMVIFVVIEFKAILFLNQMNRSLDDLLTYLKSLDWIFSGIDFITEKLLSLKEKSSYIISQIFNILFK